MGAFTSDERNPSAQTRRGLDWLNFFLADVQTGVGPFLAIYLAAFKWNQQQVGLVLTLGVSSAFSHRLRWALLSIGFDPSVP
jgi:hypothetical protein